MNIHPLRDAPLPWLGEALERFETRFRYPLGAGMHFRISHGQSYVPFFQAMGDATVWVAERRGEVLGTLAAILRMLHLPHGETRRVAYLCDLKVDPDGSAGLTLATLARTVTADLIGQGLESAYSVVMGGTSRTPANYTGRLGIPSFMELGEIAIIKVMTAETTQTTRKSSIVTASEVDAAYAMLSPARMFAQGGNSSLRSLMSPVPLLESHGQACGVVEDTRRGKRLLLDTGEELRAAHLSRFGYATISAGADLVRDALAVAADVGFPALFVAIPAQDAPAFTASLDDLSLHLAPATAYGCGLPATHSWSVDTAEI